MKKICIISSLITLSASCIIGAILLFSKTQLSNSEDNPFVLVLNSDDQTTENNFTKKISSGDYVINFHQSITCDIASGCFRSLQFGNYISLTDSSEEGGNKGINGLISLSITFSGGTSDYLKVSYGWSDNSYFDEGTISSNNPTFLFDNLSPSYFRIENSNENTVVNILSLTITYSCVKSTEPPINNLVFVKKDSYYEVKAKDTSIKEAIIPHMYNGLPVTTIAEEGFSECQELTKIVIPDSITKISTNGFYMCWCVQTFFIPSSVKEISNSAFYLCRYTSYIILNEGLEIIGDNAFYGCEYLISINIPSSVKTIGKNVFRDDMTLKEISVNDNNQKYTSKIGETNCNAIIDKTNMSLLYGSINTIVPSGVLSIGDSAFYGNGIESLYLPNTITSIGKSAFCYSSISSINIPSSIIEIKENAFAISHLSSVSFENGVKTIEKGAFTCCKYLYSLSLPASVENIGVPLINDSSINSLSIDSNNKKYTSGNNLNAIIEKETKTLLIGTGTSKINDKNYVTSIGEYAFCFCVNLTSITIPENIISISNNAFDSCKFLKEVNFVNSGIKIIPSKAFYECDALEIINIPDKVEKICTEAFESCRSLKNIIFPLTLKTLEIKSFTLCNNLTNLSYLGTIEEWKKVSKYGWCSYIGTDHIVCTDGDAGLFDTLNVFK